MEGLSAVPFFGIIAVIAAFLPDYVFHLQSVI